jgi:hypothetical protein
VNPEVQQFLARRFEAARLRPPGLDITEYARSMLAHFGGALEAFRVVGAVTDDEFTEWMNRMRVALDMEPVTARGSTTQTDSVSTSVVAQRLPGAGPPQSPPPPRSPPRFLRLVGGPKVEIDYHGGRLRVIGAELYDSQVCVLWRAAPEPDPARFSGAEIESTARNTEGLPTAERASMRRMAGRRALHDVLQGMTLVDSAGTSYGCTGGSSGGGYGETNGRTCFSPGVPADVARLTVRWVGVTFDLDLGV